MVSPFASKDDFHITIKSNLDWEKDLTDLDRIKKDALWYFKVTTKSFLMDNISYIKIDKFKYQFTPYNGMTKISPRIVNENDEYILKDNEITRKSYEKKYDNIPNKGFGNITIEGYIYDFDTKTLELSNIKDKKATRDYLKENGGVRVYRDGMRIYNYGEFGNDWLGLDQSRINAPTSKIGNKLILASVSLSRQESQGLEEKTNLEIV